LLFSRVPIREATSLISRHFEDDILRLFRQVLTSSYFSFDGQFYRQTNGVTLGSPLIPVIANFFIEDLENVALD
jgi:hypothetical protein